MPPWQLSRIHDVDGTYYWCHRAPMVIKALACGCLSMLANSHMYWSLNAAPPLISFRCSSWNPTSYVLQVSSDSTGVNIGWKAFRSLSLVAMWNFMLHLIAKVRMWHIFHMFSLQMAQYFKWINAWLLGRRRILSIKNIWSHMSSGGMPIRYCQMWWCFPLPAEGWLLQRA